MLQPMTRNAVWCRSASVRRRPFFPSTHKHDRTPNPHQDCILPPFFRIPWVCTLPTWLWSCYHPNTSQRTSTRVLYTAYTNTQPPTQKPFKLDISQSGGSFNLPLGMRYAQFVMGPAGSGKVSGWMLDRSPYCAKSHPDLLYFCIFSCGCWLGSHNSTAVTKVTLPTHEHCPNSRTDMLLVCIARLCSRRIAPP
jgi:hypothetical protein